MRMLPTSNEELSRLTHPIAKRIGRYLELQGLLERDAEHSYLNANAIEDEQDPMHQLHGSSVTYRVAVGPRQGRKVFTLQTLPASDPDELPVQLITELATWLRLVFKMLFDTAGPCSFAERRIAK
jgi:hypothetical protein